MLIETRIRKLAETRPDMACIFQVKEREYPRFTLYRTYVICASINHFVTFNTTELNPDSIVLTKLDKSLNKKLARLGYDPRENVIYTFYLD